MQITMNNENGPPVAALDLANWNSSFKEQVLNRMQQLSISKTRLASRLGTSPAYVSKLLGSEANVTMGTIVKLSQALDAELRLELVPKKDWSQAIAKLVPIPEQRIWLERQRSRTHRKVASEGPLAPFAGTRFFTKEDVTETLAGR